MQEGSQYPHDKDNDPDRDGLGDAASLVSAAYDNVLQQALGAISQLWDAPADAQAAPEAGPSLSEAVQQVQRLELHFAVH